MSEEVDRPARGPRDILDTWQMHGATRRRRSAWRIQYLPLQLDSTWFAPDAEAATKELLQFISRIAPDENVDPSNITVTRAEDKDRFLPTSHPIADELTPEEIIFLLYLFGFRSCGEKRELAYMGERAGYSNFVNHQHIDRLLSLRLLEEKKTWKPGDPKIVNILTGERHEGYPYCYFLTRLGHHVCGSLLPIYFDEVDIFSLPVPQEAESHVANELDTKKHRTDAAPLRSVIDAAMDAEERE